MCVTLSSNLRLAGAPGNVVLDAATTGFERPSVINVSQVVTLDKQDLTERIGRVDSAVLRSVATGLRRVLALT